MRGNMSLLQNFYLIVYIGIRHIYQSPVKLPTATNILKYHQSRDTNNNLTWKAKVQS